MTLGLTNRSWELRRANKLKIAKSKVRLGFFLIIAGWG